RPDRACSFARPALVRAGDDEALRVAIAGDRDRAEAHVSAREADPVRTATLRALGRAEGDLIPAALAAIAHRDDRVVGEVALRAARGGPSIGLAEALR